MQSLKKFLEGGDLRSIADVDQLVPLIQSQSDFDLLFRYLFSGDRLITMRAIDAVEKITSGNSSYLGKHKERLIDFLETASDKEFKWHLALLVSRIDLNQRELGRVWKKLSDWAKDKSESKIVRVNSLQSLFDLSQKHDHLKSNLALIIGEVCKENIPSINARIKKLV